MADPDRLAWLAARLEFSVGLFLAACFLLPTGPAYALVFYAAVLPCLAARLATQPGTLYADPAFRLGVALILWSMLTLFWGRDDGDRSGGFALGAAATLAFWTALRAAAAARARLPNLLIAVGTINALAGIARRLIAPPPQPPGDILRLHGWGITYHPALGAAVLGVCFLTALDDALRRRRATSLLALLVIGAAILLTASRGPELAVTVAAGALVAARRPEGGLLFAVCAVQVAYFAKRAGLVRVGTTGHFEIWRATWTEIAARPWFGHGLAADLPARLGADKRFPHDLYLSLLFYSGAVGLLLFVAWAGLLARRVAGAWREPETPWIAALCLNTVLAGLTDFGQITKGPGPLWLILWLPAALAAALPPAPAARIASAPAPAAASPPIP